MTSLKCTNPRVWVCSDPAPGCPSTPPAVGGACTLDAESSCVYCNDAPTSVGCVGGHWVTTGGAVCT
ncbi:MAG TPA: hypothetical protein VH062_13285 [Polyangiaceae bacterium]|nr:hypothetical protein [Polyangiaceae bacterium]